jgi:hypothetical protein
MLQLPDRAGSRPKTSSDIPHRQTDQNPSPKVYSSLLGRFLALPGTASGESLVSVPGAKALFLAPLANGNARFGFISGREFAHLHPATDGSFHMALAPDDVAEVLIRGWGELHPLASTGKILPTIAMVFAPRNEQEIDIVLKIAAAALENAKSGDSSTCSCGGKW